MKRMLLLVFLIIDFIFFSCSKEGGIYSCNPEINEFVVENLSEIQVLNRSEFIEVDKTLQLAFFKALIPERKQAVWLGKMDELLHLNWTPLEREHIKQAYNMLQNNLKWYEEPEKYEDDIDIYCYKWVEYAKEKLGWNNEFIYFTVIDPNPITKTEDNKLLFTNSNNSMMEVTSIKVMGESTEGPPTTDCTCNTGANLCGSSLMTCKKWNCIPTRGCGTWGMSTCDGGCFRNDL